MAGGRLLLSVLSIILFFLQMLVIVVSWVVTAVMPDSDFHSLLSSEGIRWLFWSFTDNLLTPILPWMILLCMAIGVMRRSRLLHADVRDYRQRVALSTAGVLLLVAVALLVVLTAVPHAILLSVTGHLFPSSFSEGLFPVLMIILMLISLSYGLVSGTLHGLVPIYDAFCCGLRNGAYLFLPYILAAELIAEIKFFL